MLKEQFETVLAEFGSIIGQRLTLDDNDTATFTVDEEIIVNLKYLEASDVIVAFSPVGGFGGTGTPEAGEKALDLLRLSELGGRCNGFTAALDEEADLVLAMDRRTALEISSADALAAWMDGLICAVHAIRDRFAEHFPIEGRD